MKDILEVDVCIVGSGFCGYTCYKKLSNSNKNILLVEGGDLQTPTSPDGQKFFKVANNDFVSEIKLKNKTHKVLNSLDLSFAQRAFTLGGSSETWSGYIKPFEPSSYLNKYSEFENQHWDDFNLLKFNNESLEILNSPIKDFNPENVSKSIGVKLEKLPKGLSYTTYAWAKSPLRLKSFWINKATSSVDKLENKSRNVLYGHKLVDAEIKEQKIYKLIFKNNKNKTFFVKAKKFIIALGGVENGRFIEILRKKNSLEKSYNYINNFQEHPSLGNCAYVNLNLQRIPEYFFKRFPVKDSQNQKEGDIAIVVKAWDGIGTPKATIWLRKRYNFNFRLRGLRAKIRSFVKSDDYFNYAIDMRCEQRPCINSNLNFNNSITKLNWEVAEQDFKIYSQYLKRFISFFKSKGYIKDFALSSNAYLGYYLPKHCDGQGHHMGTVPLTSTDKLLDRNFRLLSYKNTYVIGSSAFPTSGFENPTHLAISTALAAVDHINKNF